MNGLTTNALRATLAEAVMMTVCCRQSEIPRRLSLVQTPDDEDSNNKARKAEEDAVRRNVSSSASEFVY